MYPPDEAICNESVSPSQGLTEEPSGGHAETNSAGPYPPSQLKLKGGSPLTMPDTLQSPPYLNFHVDINLKAMKVEVLMWGHPDSPKNTKSEAKVVWTEVPAGQIISTPTMELNMEQANRLMDALWGAGVRPSKYLVASEGLVGLIKSNQTEGSKNTVEAKLQEWNHHVLPPPHPMANISEGEYKALKDHLNDMRTIAMGWVGTQIELSK